MRIHEEKISEGFAASDSLCCFSDFSRPKFANVNISRKYLQFLHSIFKFYFIQGLNLTQNGIPVSVERLENDPWTFEEETKPVLQYSSELEVATITR